MRISASEERARKLMSLARAMAENQRALFTYSTKTERKSALERATKGKGG
jgi:hypothetical protein